MSRLRTLFLHRTAILICLMGLNSCGKPMAALTKTPQVSHAFCDFSSYAVSFASPEEQTGFEKHLKSWCSEKGYAEATQAELQVLQHAQQTGAYKITGVKYLDPANPACSLLITYRTAEGNQGLVGLHLTRDGSSESLERQSVLVEAQRDEFLKEFAILSRLN